LLVGGTIGLVSGYLGGMVSGFLMWFIDVLLAFPALVFALALVSFVGPHLSSVVLVFAVLAIPGYARVARALTLTYATENFVLAARATGAGVIRVMAREILPNVIVPLSSFAALGAAIAIIAEGSLAFLGLSDPGSISWGNMIAQGQDQLYDGPQAAIAPMIVMFLTILSLNFIGERLGGGARPPRRSALRLATGAPTRCCPARPDGQLPPSARYRHCVPWLPTLPLLRLQVAAHQPDGFAGWIGGPSGSARSSRSSPRWPAPCWSRRSHRMTGGRTRQVNPIGSASARAASSTWQRRCAPSS